MNLSFEVVPRNDAAIAEQLSFVSEHLSCVNTINVPDLLRLPIRSWQSGNFINREKYHFIPHLRAIDFDLRESRLADLIDEFQLDRVLLVSGDPPPDRSHSIFDTRVLDMITYVRHRFPKMIIFVALDPYRSSVKKEKTYMLKKLDLGADYVMSQPFFDLRLLEIYGELLPGDKLYWGISPVVNEKSAGYWERMNNVIFPAGFEATYDWNIEFAKKTLQYCLRSGGNAYFMPINISLERYFLPIAAFLKDSRSKT